MTASEVHPISTASIEIGSVYEHYKKQRYRVLALARHSETQEECVVYQALYGDKGIWVRSVAMFLEPVLVDGRLQPRFRQIMVHEE